MEPIYPGSYSGGLVIFAPQDMHSKTPAIIHTRKLPASPVPVTASAVHTAVQDVPHGGGLSLPGRLKVIEAGPSRMEGAMHRRQQDLRGHALRDTPLNLRDEEAKLRGAKLALADLLALQKPNLALVQARRNGIGASVLENRRALLVELARPPKRVVEDPALTGTPEHLRPRRLDGSAAPPPFENSSQFQATLAELLRVLAHGTDTEIMAAVGRMDPGVHAAPASVLRKHIAVPMRQLRARDLGLLQKQLKDQQVTSILVAIKDAVDGASIPRTYPPRHEGPRGR